MHDVDRIAQLLEGARFAVCMTGAGVSTGSGIPDFRSPGTGLWANVDPMEVATISAFREDAEKFWSFYSERMGMLTSAEPNPAHVALARLEDAGYLGGLITQNIDRLHHAAGSREVAEVHGSIDQAECLTCGSTYPYDRVAQAISAGVAVPTCDCGAPLKPGVVLFGEGLPQEAFSRAAGWAEKADLMLVAGSSLGVYPVAGLPELTLSGGGSLIIINGAATPYDEFSAVTSRERVEEMLPRVADALGA